MEAYNTLFNNAAALLARVLVGQENYQKTSTYDNIS
jgi:hypothetical protein